MFMFKFCVELRLELCDDHSNTFTHVKNHLCPSFNFFLADVFICFTNSIPTTSSFLVIQCVLAQLRSLKQSIPGKKEEKKTLPTPYYAVAMVF